jgi:hypothetical protein
MSDIEIVADNLGPAEQFAACFIAECEIRKMTSDEISARVDMASALVQFVCQGGDAATLCNIINSRTEDGNARLHAAASELRKAA